MAFLAFARETLTVSTTVVTFTSATVQPAGGVDPARQAIVHVRSGGPFNFTIDGGTTFPTSTGGSGPWYAGSAFVINGATNIASFRAIRDNTAVADAVLECEYLR